MVVELNFPKFMALKQECKTGGLVIQRHYEIKFELQELAAGALVPSVVRDDPQIYPGRSSNVEETEGMSTPAEERGDLLVRFLWKHQTDCILDVRTTAQSSAKRRRATSKPACTSASFSPFVVSCDGVLGNEAKVLQNLAGSLAKKSAKSYSVTSNFMKSRS